MSEPHPTRREPAPRLTPDPPPVTRHEQSEGATPTRREAAGDLESVLAASVVLPPALRGRFIEVERMAQQGGEADLFLAREGDGRERVLKVYRPHLQVDAEVWQVLASARSQYVVDIVDTGQLPDGRFFELLEYLPEGSLRGLGVGSRTFPGDRVKEIVRQLAAGLAVLHERGITHRDLKPENVLVRSADPLALVLTDFGLSRRLDTSMRFSTEARTDAYAAPEAWSAHISPARDWWSLGIMVRELATGERPFHGLHERVIQLAVTTKPVAVEAVSDPRLRLLCSGLLVMDHAKRWGRHEVESWLAGDSPMVPDRRLPLEVKAFAFEEQYFNDPESLATAMAERWSAAARRYFTAMGEPWQALKIWLRQFDDPDRYPPHVVSRRQDLIDELERNTASPNVKLLHMLACLNPALPPVYRQVHVDADTLRYAASTAGTDSTGKVGKLIEELWADRLLPVLAGFEGGAELAAIDVQWQRAMVEFDAVATELGERPELADIFDDPGTHSQARAAMLYRASGVDCGADWSQALHERLTALPIPVPWFRAVVAAIDRDPVRTYAGLIASGAAQAEAERSERDRLAREQAAARRVQVWEERELKRRDGRSAASATAMAGVGLATLGWFVLWIVSAKTGLALVAFFIVVVATLTAELVLAHHLGGDHGPNSEYALQQNIRTAAGEIGHRFREYLWPGVIGVVVLLFALRAEVTVVVLLVVGAAAHVVWALSRHRRWSESHEREHRKAMDQ